MVWRLGCTRCCAWTLQSASRRRPRGCRTRKSASSTTYSATPSSHITRRAQTQLSFQALPHFLQERTVNEFEMSSPDTTLHCKIFVMAGSTLLDADHALPGAGV